MIQMDNLVHVVFIEVFYAIEDLVTATIFTTFEIISLSLIVSASGRPVAAKVVLLRSWHPGFGTNFIDWRDNTVLEVLVGRW